MTSGMMAHTLAPRSFSDDEIMALELQFEEMRAPTLTDMAQFAADSRPDAGMAIFALQQEIIDHWGIQKDVELAHSLARAVDEDGPLIDAITQGDHRVIQDRRMAVDMSNIDDDLEDPPALVPIIEAIDCRSGSTDLIENIIQEEEEKNGEGPAMTYADRQNVVLTKLLQKPHKCVACMDQFRHDQIIQLECGHRYCRDCTKELIMKATKDEERHPARCCQRPIPSDTIKEQLSEQEAKIFDAAVIEFSTENRTYCHINSCGRFIPPSQIDGDRGLCEECLLQTCVTCKAAAHAGHCPEDPDLKATLALVAAEGWQRCRGCGLLVDLLSGCFHMRCACGTEFCFLCNEPWKNCPCPNWDETRLVQRAEELVDRNAVGIVPPAERAQRVGQMRNQIRENHECAHPRRFERVLDGGIRGFACEMCSTRHSKFILRCPRCEFQVCEACRRHRM